MIKFEKGNCLKAAWDLAMDKISDKDEHVIVHAMREIYGGEVWGGHAFVLNKTTNRVLSEANNDMQENGGKPLDVSFEEAKEMWNLQPNDPSMYKEYTIQEFNAKLFENGLDNVTLEFWDLKYENWQDDDWNDYMNNHFMPLYCPNHHKKRQDYLAKAGK